MNNFWLELSKPFVVLAPMENVTDFVFREIIAKHLPKPDVFFTEFTNTDGLASEKGYAETVKRLKFSANQRPIVAQIWGSNPENFLKSAQICLDLGFDGVDINMGCPDKSVIKSGGGAGCIGNIELVREIIIATKEGLKNKIPLSVKTRLGNKSITYQEWTTFLLEQKIDTLTIHGRTPSQMSKGLANWDAIGEIVKLKNNISPNTIIIGNGDVLSKSEVMSKHNKYGVDGVMIARGIFKNPWIFDDKNKKHETYEYIDLALKHTNLFYKTYQDTKHFAVLKKFFKMYINGFNDAGKLRIRLMETKRIEEVTKILEGEKVKYFVK